VTATFVIDAQKQLTEDPAVASAILLSIIASQLNGSALLPHSTLQPVEGLTSTARLVNALFYTSLGISLVNVMLGPISLQWVQDLRPEKISLAKDYPHLRCVRQCGAQSR